MDKGEERVAETRGGDSGGGTARRKAPKGREGGGHSAGCIGRTWGAFCSRRRGGAGGGANRFLTGHGFAALAWRLAGARHNSALWSRVGGGSQTGVELVRSGWIRSSGLVWFWFG